MLLHLSLRCRCLGCLERSLVAWILVVGTLFVAAVTLRYVSIMIEGSFPRGRASNSNQRMNFSVPNSSCQRLSHPPVFSNNSLDAVYVISLPRRTDRRLQMNRLRDALHLNWTYRDACEANASVVTTIMRQVHVLRSQLMPQPKPGDARMRRHAVMSAFDWPHDLENAICSREPLQPSGADLWTLPSSHSLSDPAIPAEMADPYAFTRSPSDQASGISDPTPLACASGNNVSAASLPKLPLHRRLTTAKVACWYSHLQTIRGIANGIDEAVLVLEDDVDIERDIKPRLQALLDALPNDWDIVYLGKLKNSRVCTIANGTAGHCWSDETRFSPLRNISSQLSNGHTTWSALHPASSPKCTHAYMLSRTGARRVIAHLRHPPFAYSRAIDQALAWLIQSGRLRAFSIVPPVVVQRKIAVSDVMPGLGSAWRDELYNGVLGRM
jgi:GR25 family glycosyltransferase involved in LPS biosynthesis